MGWRRTGETVRRGYNLYERCVCDCGRESVVMLLRGEPKSKQCRSCHISESHRTHGQSKAPIYNVWLAMRQRCNNPNDRFYADYGGRGIRVCERWQSFENFAADMGKRPEGTSIDRFPDKDGNYKPGNCRWATVEEQSRNRRNNVMLTYEGRTMTLAEWGREKGIPIPTLWCRVVKFNWPVEAALTRRPGKGRLTKSEKSNL